MAGTQSKLQPAFSRVSVLHYDLRSDARLSFCAKAVSSLPFESRRGGIGRRAGLKIQKSPILSHQSRSNAIHDSHREIGRFAVNWDGPRGMVLRQAKVEQK
jgi:hypothetical protein